MRDGNMKTRTIIMENKNNKILESGYSPKVESRSNMCWENYYRESTAVNHYVEDSFSNSSSTRTDNWQ